MNDKRIPAGEVATLRLRHADGDIDVSGWDEDEILAQADGEIGVESAYDEIVLSTPGDASVSIPAGLSFRFDDIAGDTNVHGVDAAIEGKRIAGDLLVEESGPLNIDAVGGDVRATACLGDLRVGAVGGDLAVASLTGTLTASVGGDLKVSSARGSIAANAGGDARVEFASLCDAAHAIQAGGDIVCRLPADSDTTLNLQYGGSLRTGGPVSKERGSGHVSRLVLGTGATTINLMAGGDISLEAGAGFDTAHEDEFTGELGESMQHMTSNLEAQLSAMAGQLEAQLNGLPCADEIATRITERVQRAMERAEANVEKAMRRAERQAARADRRAAAARARSEAWGRTVSSRPAKPDTAPVSDEERAAVLRMIEEGKISVDQAELLLSAMGP
jgi:hypothetical protein